MIKDFKKLPPLYPYIIWLVAASFFFYKYLIQVSPSVMTNDLMHTFKVNGAGLGNLAAFYFYAYLVMQIPVGILLDKFSPRLLTTIAIFACSLGTLIFSQANTLWLASLSRALMGTGAAFAAVSSFKLASLWFTPKRFALVSGMFMTAAMLGAVGGQMPLLILLENFGWRNSLVIISILGFTLGIIYFMVVRDKSLAPSLQRSQPSLNGLTAIILNKQVWILSLYSGLAFGPISAFGGLWGVPFLKTAYQLSSNDAAFAISFIFIGFALGAPFWGWLSDFIKRRKPVLFAGTFLGLICLLELIYLPNQSLYRLVIFLLCFGFSASGFFVSFAMIKELFPIVLIGTIIGFMNTFNSICEALFEPMVGALLDLTGNVIVMQNAYDYQFSVHGYYFSLLVLPVSLVCALISLTFIEETYCQAKAD